MTGGTDVHQVVLDVARTGAGAAALSDLHAIGVQANAMPLAYDPCPEPSGSGLRLGSGALATRGFGEAAFAELADLLVAALAPDRAPARRARGARRRSPTRIPSLASPRRA